MSRAGTVDPATPQFPPTTAAARERVRSVDARAHAQRRNFIEGSATGLSPYITHGMIEVPDIFRALSTRTALGAGDKLVQEFGWREFFHHVWRHRGDAILGDLGAPVSPVAYADRLPEDVRAASTGVPVIDHAVRCLYATGYLHNHARMWLASYLVHLRKVHWRAGADWMYGHLLDGDLASNHLSWQWIAGTFSRKPYLFNADNVARYAPPAWHSPGTVIDDSYEALDRRAREQPDCGPESRRPAPVDVPPLFGAPSTEGDREIPAAGDRDLRLRHPWDLGFDRAQRGIDIGVLHAPFHDRFPWSALRWDWVLSALKPGCTAIWVGDLRSLRTGACRGLSARETLNPGYAAALAAVGAEPIPVPRLFSAPDRAFGSFSQFWRHARLSPDDPR